MRLTEFYVSPDGNDEWSGALPQANDEGTDGPLATLLAAREAVRRVRSEADSCAEIRVMLRQGKYFMQETLILTPDDGGSRDCPLTYCAYPGETPIVSGGVKLENWQPHEGEILKHELAGSRGGKWKFRQLFCNGQRQMRSSWPKQDPDDPLVGWAAVTGSAAEGTHSRLLRNYDKGDTWVEGSLTAFTCGPEVFQRSWSKPTEVEINVFIGKNWLNEIIPVKKIDEARGVIELARPIFQLDGSPWFYPTPLQEGNRFRAGNALEDLTRPGEWCFDSEEGVVYFWPPCDIGSAEVVVPRLDSLFDLHGASWLTIAGLTLTETTDGDDYHRVGHEGYGPVFPKQGLKYCGEAIHLHDAEHCRIEHDHFDAVGGTAIYLEGHNARNSIVHNHISHPGTYGVAAVGSRDDHPMYNRIEDNDIHHTGSQNKYANAVFLGLSNMNTVAHNHIHHIPLNGICLGNSGYGRNIVEYNDIHDTSAEISDCGGINAWMEDPFPTMRADVERAGHIIRYNFIHDVHSLSHSLDEDGNLVDLGHGKGSLAMAIYLDNGTSNCHIYGNLLVRAGRWGVYVQGGRNNVVENNIILECGCACGFSDLVAHWFAPQMRGYMRGTRFSRNIFVSGMREVCVHTGHDWSPELIEQCDGNLFHLTSVDELSIDINDMEDGKRGEKKSISYAEWQTRGFDQHSILADPLFVNLENGDYSLKADSPALALGFQPIDLSRVGVREPGSR